MSQPPQILIFGAGAVGAFYGALLARSSPKSTASDESSTPPPPSVSCVCRSNYAAVSSQGFKLTSPTHGNWTWRPSQVFSSPSAARDSGIKWDYVVITTKALPDVSDDSALLEGLISSGGATTSIVLIQNGLGVEAPYAARFPDAKAILSGVTVVSAAQPEAGVIRHNRWTRITIGAYTPSNSEAEASGAQTFVDLLKDGGQLQLLRWHKLAINAAMNPSSVLSGGASNASMSRDPLLAAHLKAVMEEVLSAAEVVCGAKMPKGFASAEQILNSTRKNDSDSRPSMWADWEGGKPMELEVILGEPVRAARRKGLEMPRLESMYALLKMAQQERDRRAKEQKSKL
ncbi:hypothetical protein ANO11243_045260 [Dothideomycetidae sp. 11243]|nr:hypothetical protein ANO11243_045260 [fungal sp. No.11243]